MSDSAIMEYIGRYIQDERLKQNKTQEQVAEAAGINRWTLTQIEKGEGTSLTSLIRVLRSLKLLNVFNAFQSKDEISPMEMAKLEKNKRQRARKKKESNSEKNSSTISEW